MELMPSAETPRLPVLSTHSGDIGWMLCQPRNIETPPQMSPEEQLFWTTTVLSIDLALEDKNNPHTREFLKRFGTMKPKASKKREILQPQNRLLESIQTIIRSDPSVQYVALANGTFPDMCVIWNDPETSERMKSDIHSLIVTNTEGSVINVPRIVSQLPPEFGKRTLLIHDDVADTCSAIAVLVEEVEIQKGEELFNSRLSEILPSTTGKPYRINKDYYRELACRIEKNGILLAISVYKNEPFFESMSNYVKRALYAKPRDPWANRQKILLQHSLHMKQEDWLMGLGMDTDIKGDVIRDALDPELLAHPKVKPLVAHLPEFKIRFGSTVKTLIALQEREPGENGERRYAIDEFKQWVFDCITEKLLYIAYHQR
jgi:hypothetical protein